MFPENPDFNFSFRANNMGGGGGGTQVEGLSKIITSRKWRYFTLIDRLRHIYLIKTKLYCGMLTRNLRLTVLSGF
jgi:hypothetical protein